MMICPLCKKDLTIAMQILGTPRAFQFHIKAHMSEYDEKIQEYINEHSDQFPSEFLQLILDRDKDLKILDEVM
jgi:hypothetical protein